MYDIYDVSRVGATPVLMWLIVIILMGGDSTPRMSSLSDILHAVYSTWHDSGKMN
jgi:hypothetical protein